MFTGGFVAREFVRNNDHLFPSQLDTSGHVIYQLAQNLLVMKSFQSLKETGKPWQDKTFSLLHNAVAVTDGIWMFNTAANCHSVADVIAATACCVTTLAGIEGTKFVLRTGYDSTKKGCKLLLATGSYLISNDSTKIVREISHKVTSATGWCFSRGLDVLTDTVVSIGLNPSSLKDLHSVLVNPEIFKESIRFDLYHQFKELLANAKQKELIIWLREWWFNIDPSSILKAECPQKEFFNQLNLLYDTKIPTPNPFRADLPLIATFSTVEEALSRLLIQDMILKRLVKKVIHIISPQHASLADGKIYAACRIVLTSAIFSFSAKRNTEEQMAHFMTGIALGVIKERNGILGSIGANTMNRFVGSIPEIYSC